jgi:ketosteroid isomerase-like protein
MAAPRDLAAAGFAIRQLHARYADALWRKDPESFAALFARDAEWKVAGMHMKGRDEIRETFARFMVHTGHTLMTFRSPIVEEVDGVLTARTYVTEQNAFASGQTADTIGIYYERFVEEDGELRFAWRHWDMDYIGPPEMTAAFYDVADYGPPPAQPGPDASTTVRRDFLFTAPDGTPTAQP